MSFCPILRGQSVVLTNSVFAEKKEQVKIEPKVRTEKVIDYQIKHYAYDQWEKP